MDETFPILFLNRPKKKPETCKHHTSSQVIIDTTPWSTGVSSLWHKKRRRPEKRAAKKRAFF